MKRLLTLLLLVISISTFGQTDRKDRSDHEHHHGHDEDDDDDDDEDDDDGCLPVDLISFKGVAKNKCIELNWSTASETNNDYYTIFKSPNGFEYWELVGSIQGIGNSIVQTDYKFLDKEPISGLNYYVLVQTDFNGARKYFDPVSVFISIPPEYIIWDHYNFLGQQVK